VTPLKTTLLHCRSLFFLTRITSFACRYGQYIDGSPTVEENVSNEQGGNRHHMQGAAARPLEDTTRHGHWGSCWLGALGLLFARRRFRNRGSTGGARPTRLRRLCSGGRRTHHAKAASPRVRTVAAGWR